MSILEPQLFQSPTKLHTLSGLRLEHTNFTRPKPLLLLAYLCLEGKQEKRFLAELFWQGASNRLNSLAKALSQLRRVGVVDKDETHAWATVSTDINDFLGAWERKEFAAAVTLYQDSFLSGFYLPDWSVEVEEWVYSTREYLAARMREALLELAEKSSDNKEATRYAERAYTLDATLEPDLIPRLYKFLTHTPHAPKLREEAKEYRISLEQPKAIASNLPARGTSFIGRDLERLELAELLTQDGSRLVTVVGQGGVGKTRLATEVAREVSDSFRDGTLFVSLETLTTPEQIVQSLASLFSVQLNEGEGVAQIVNVIADKQLLLLVDNFEHVLEYSALLSELLKDCPHVKVLVTSRTRLNLEEEWLYALEGFSVPEKRVRLEDAELNDAITLFVQRAKKVKQGFTLTQACLPFVLSICDRVEGLPLGIELAASWVKTLPCQEIAERLDEADFLTTSLSNVSERHQSLRQVFEGSWQLLSKEEQKVLGKLSVFQGGFTREAAREVADASLLMLARLVDKSLLRVSAGGRYDFHPLLQGYMQEKLAATNEESKTHMAHAHYFLALAERAKIHLRSASAGEWLKYLHGEVANINTALTKLCSSETAPLATRFVSALSQFWQSQSYLSQGRKSAREILKLTSHQPSLERARLLLVAGNLAWIQGDYHEAKTFYQESLTAWQIFGNKEGEAKILNNLALIARNEGNYAYAKQTLESYLELCRNLNDTEGMARANYNLGTVYHNLAEFDKAQDLFQESLRLGRRLEDKKVVGTSLFNIATIAYERQDYHAAMDYAKESLRWQREVAYKIGEALTLTLLGESTCALGEHKQARAYLRESLELRKEINGKPGLISSLEAFGDLELAEGKSNKAVYLWASAASVREMINLPVPPYLKERRESNVAKAREILGEAAFNTAWTKGSLLGLEQAIIFTLESV
jgi:predicted ATPase